MPKGPVSTRATTPLAEDATVWTSSPYLTIFVLPELDPERPQLSKIVVVGQHRTCTTNMRKELEAATA